MNLTRTFLATPVLPEDEAVAAAGLKILRQSREAWIMNTPQRRRIPTVNQVVQQQREDAERDHNALAKAAPTAPTTGTAVALPDTRSNIEQYLDEVAPAQIVGRLIKFTKEGVFATADDGEPVPRGAGFTALCDQVVVGWLRFRGEGQAPDRTMGLLYSDFRMPLRETLGDLDPHRWPIGLDKQPTDPWLHQQLLPLQCAETQALFTFATTSRTGRRAVGGLLRHFDRMKRTNADELPVVRLEAGGFNHRDSRIGWVPVPMFTVIGRRPRDSAAKPDTSLAADLNDGLPDDLR